MIKTKVTALLKKKKLQSKKHNKHDKNIKNTMKGLFIKKRTTNHRSDKIFMKTKDSINQNKEINDHISPDSAHLALDRWSVLAEEGEECNFDYPPSDDEFNMSKVVNELTY